MNNTPLPYDYLAEILKTLYDPWLWAWPLVVGALLIGGFSVALILKRRKERGAWDEVDLKPEVEGAATSEMPPASAPTEVSLVDEIRAVDQSAWLKRLSTGLTRTRQGLVESLRGIAQTLGGGSQWDAQTGERIHEALYRADVGVKTADKLVEALRQEVARGSRHSWEDLRGTLEAQVTRILSAAETPGVSSEAKPRVILVVGVNGVGKTTTIGKLGALFMSQGKQPILCAADTFRAAAIDQLRVWADRLGVEIVAHQAGSDPAAVAFDGVKAAKARGADVLMIDTAGRLHNKDDLMAQLDKIKRVVSREMPEAPHETWLVLDATTGQNAVMQVKAFMDVAKITGLVVTKLDGTAKGGVLVAIADQFALPIRYIGVGEKASDLRAFNAADYARMMFEEG